MQHFKHNCKTLTLKDDPELIRLYREIHHQVWPGILQGMKEVGIPRKEVFPDDNRWNGYVK